MTDSVQLFTTSYRKFTDDMGLPVQASNGRPKYALAYDLRFKMPPMYPRWELVKGNISVAEFREAYWQDLEEFGVDNLREVFAQIAKMSGQSRLVLMCFEARVRDCHRGDFAMWWERTTGEKVPELPEAPGTPSLI